MPTTSHFPPHLTIRASAGSGKTHALVTRFVRLMALGAPPERIGALTFTRKSAGEFLDKILHRLVGAATDDGAARRLADDVEMPQWGKVEFGLLLERVVRAMPRLGLATLDGFFVRLLRSFALEFGLGGDFAVSDAHQQAVDFDEVCRRLFAAGDGLSADQTDFIESFDLATFGQEERSLLGNLKRFVDSLHAAWWQDPDEARWGNLALIWPEGGWFQLEREIDVAAETRQLLAAVAQLKATDKRQPAQFAAFVDAVATHAPGTPLPTAIAYFFKRCAGDVASLQSLLSGTMTVKIWKDLELGPDVGRPLAALLGHVMAREMRLLARRTRGQWRILASYEKLYEEHVRRRGRLTFEDVKFMLAGGGRPDGIRVSLNTSEEGRLHLDYRLDGIFDHWLLDEFQDTSLLQWRVIERVVDDIFADPEGRRTYFQVGDVKQSIYRWRGGEPGLFGYVLQRYGDSLHQGDLAVSFRSAPAIIETVNRVFGDEATMRELFPARAVDRWEWPVHAAHHADWSGFAALVRPPVEDGRAPTAAERFEVVARLLREVRPLERDLTCAILFRSNDDVQAATAWLRAQPGLPPIASETDVAPALDNPVTLAALSLLRFAAHPGDRLAWQHVQMTPVAAWLEQRQWPPASVVREVLTTVAQAGFEAVLQSMLAAWSDLTSGWDGFTRQRTGDLLTLARQFDEGGSRNIDEFLRFVSLATVREMASRRSVQVMTIHKAKGLEFDVVFLPKLGGKSFKDDRSPVLRYRPRLDAASWLLLRPRAEFVAADPRLTHGREEDVAANCHEGFCTLYVAMTRAARALYLVGEAREDSSAATGATWLERSLATGEAGTLTADGREFALGYAAGDPHWFESMAPRPAAARPSPRRFEPPPLPGLARYPRFTPSSKESHALTAGQVFSTSASPARLRGVLIHEAFEQVADPTDLSGLEKWGREQALSHRVASSSHAEFDEALQTVRNSLADAAVRTALTPPPGSDLWRERTFEIIHDDTWITGTIDRVMVSADRARLIDFKTDAIPPGDEAVLAAKVEGYRPQIDLYRRVVARLTGLDPARIDAVLIFTALRRVVAMDPA